MERMMVITKPAYARRILHLGAVDLLDTTPTGVDLLTPTFSEAVDILGNKLTLDEVQAAAPPVVAVPKANFVLNNAAAVQASLMAQAQAAADKHKVVLALAAAAALVAAGVGTILYLRSH